MDIKKINAEFSISEQISYSDIGTLAKQNVKSIICNRPDNEVEAQPSNNELQHHAALLNIEIHYLPVIHDKINVADVHEFELAFHSVPKPIHGYCRSGLRAMTLWGLMQIKNGEKLSTVHAAFEASGNNFEKFHAKFFPIIQQLSATQNDSDTNSYDIVIIGAGSAGISVAASLLKRIATLDIAIIDPAEFHYYQPGFTFVGAGVFSLKQNQRTMNSVIPKNVSWIKSAVVSFSPAENSVTLKNGACVSYQRLIVCPGLKLHWAGIEGLPETLGKNGVTSNYRPDLAPYTWELVQQLKSGTAIFTQPPMPIKCAGAPQKALYLSADHWHKSGLLGKTIKIEFCNAGAVLFGVKEYVPALQAYMDKYQVEVQYSQQLIKIDGPNRTCWFETTNASGEVQVIEKKFTMIHVCPPQVAPDFIRESPLADKAGWVDVDKFDLRHKKYTNIWALGDVTNTPNAKTAAAVRAQVPVVASNILADRAGIPRQFGYNGYGSCPLTVERGKIVLAEFGYSGKLLPTFPALFIKGTIPSKTAWFLKEKILPTLYWQGMLKGREWLVPPQALERVKSSD